MTSWYLPLLKIWAWRIVWIPLWLLKSTATPLINPLLSLFFDKVQQILVSLVFYISSLKLEERSHKIKAYLTNFWHPCNDCSTYFTCLSLGCMHFFFPEENCSDSDIFLWIIGKMFYIGFLISLNFLIVQKQHSQNKFYFLILLINIWFWKTCS